jgi:hypothetical protein
MHVARASRARRPDSLVVLVVLVDIVRQASHATVVNSALTDGERQ